MKKILFIFGLLASIVSHSQSTYYIRADSTRLEKVGGNNELILLNGIRSRTGAYLKNGLNGRTLFSYAGDSISVSGTDLILWRGGGTQNVTVTMPGGLPSLTDGKVWIGNGSNVATERNFSGDFTVNNIGAATLATVNGNVGTFTNMTATVNGKGLITAASSGITPLLPADTSSMLANYLRTAGDLSPLFTTTESSHNIAFSQVSQAQNLFYGSPNGSAGNPTFRALVASDLPATSPYTWQTVMTAGNTSNLAALINKDAIAVTSTDGLVLANATAATVGVPVQQSPRLRLRSSVWNTTATAATNTDDWDIESVPVSGLVPKGVLKFKNSANGAAYTNSISMTAAGAILVADGTNSLPSVAFASQPNTGFYHAGANDISFVSNGGRQHAFSGADFYIGLGSNTPALRFGAASNVILQMQNGASGGGQMNFTTAALAAGIGMDFQVDGTLKIRTRAQTGDASLTALNITGSGYVNSTSGYRVAGAATSRKMLVGDGTNFIPSTETWAVPGTAGNVLYSDGTNWTATASTGIGRRFGVSGEDATAAQDRAFDIGTNQFNIKSTYYNDGFSGFYMAGSYPLIAMGGGPNGTVIAMRDDTKYIRQTADSILLQATVKVTNLLKLGDNNTNQAGELRFYEDFDFGINYVSLKSPSLAANTIYTLPNAYPAVTGYVLSSTDAGIWSWIPATGALTNGSGTEANGTAVDLGGTLTGDAEVDVGNNHFLLHNAGREYLKIDGSTQTAQLGASDAYVKTNDGTAKIFIVDPSLAAAANGYVWSLVDDATGEGAWAAAGGGGWPLTGTGTFTGGVTMNQNANNFILNGQGGGINFKTIADFYIGDPDNATYIHISGSDGGDDINYVSANGHTFTGVINSGAAILPTSNDGAALGSTTKQWSDLFLAEGGVINWDNGDMTITQASNVMTVGGGSLAVTDLTGTGSRAVLADASGVLSAPKLTAYQTADAVYTSDATLNNTDLSVSVVNGGVYRVSVEVFTTCGAGDILFDFDGGSATVSSMVGQIFSFYDGSLNVVDFSTLSDDISFLFTDGYNIRFSFVFNITASSNGTLILRSSQNTSNGSPTTILKNSNIIATKLN